jgi:hypothetical protein
VAKRSPSDILENSGILNYYGIPSQTQMLQRVFLDDAAPDQSTMLGNLLNAALGSSEAESGGSGVSDDAGTQPTDILTMEDATVARNTIMSLTSGVFTHNLLTDDDLRGVPNLKSIYRVYYEGGESFDDADIERDGTGGYFGKTFPQPGTNTVSIKNMLKINDPIYPNGTAEPPINTNPSAPTRAEPCLSAHLLQTPLVGPAVREAGPVQFYMNSIPTLERSACVPYINLRFKTKGQRDHSGMNILRFLGYTADEIKNSPMGSTMPVAAIREGADEAGESNSGFVGMLSSVAAALGGGGSDNATAEEFGNAAYATMELFTTPQSLVNYDYDRYKNSSGEQVGNQILDKSRPFMTLKGISITHVPARRGTIATIQAKLDLVLHDRSRLSDVASLLAPSVFSRTEVMFEYGWSHPAGNNQDNVYGEFLNSMRAKQKFYLVRSDYTFTQDGQVNISATIQNASTRKLAHYTMAEGFVVDPRRVWEGYAAMFNANKTVPDALPKDFFRSSNATDAGAVLPYSVYQTIRSEIISKLDDPEEEFSWVDAQEVIDRIGQEMTSATQNAAAPNSVYGVINSKMNSWDDTPGDMHLDPFLRQPATSDTHYNQTNYTNRSEYVSFGKAFLSLIGQPLANTNDFDEVQVFFHSLNSQAGALWGMNLSSYPIKITELRNAMRAKFLDVEDASILSAFDVLTDIVEDITAPQLGIVKEREATTPAPAPDAARPDDSQIDQPAIDSWITEKMRKFGCAHTSEFRPPDLAYILDVVQHDDSDRWDMSSNEAASKTICRVHVYDTGSSPYDAEKIILRSITNNPVVGSGASAASSTDDAELTARAGSGTHASAQAAVPTTTPSPGTAASAEPASVLSAVEGRVPTLRYGTATSAITSIDVRGTTGGRVGTAFVMRGRRIDRERADPEADQGRDPVPHSEFQLVPAVLTVNTLGCPILSYAQQFLIVMNTGTSLEQIYGITRLSHTIGPGDFKTTMTMYPMGAGTMVDSNSLYSRLNSIMQRENAESDDTAPGAQLPSIPGL